MVRQGQKIWQFSDPDDYQFARAGRCGTWAIDSEGVERRIRPLILEWLAGSDVLGDFVWPGLADDLVVVERVAQGLREQFSGFELCPVEMFQEERLYKLKRKPRTRRILLPYQGPNLYDVWVTKVVGVDLVRSSVKKTVTNKGKTIYEAEGIEEFGSKVDTKTFELSCQHIQRKKGEGLYVHVEDLDGCDIFHIREFLGFKYCTSAAKEFIEQEGFTNVRFLEVGEAI